MCFPPSPLANGTQLLLLQLPAPVESGWSAAGPREHMAWQGATPWPPASPAPPQGGEAPGLPTCLHSEVQRVGRGGGWELSRGRKGGWMSKQASRWTETARKRGAKPAACPLAHLSNLPSFPGLSLDSPSQVGGRGQPWRFPVPRVRIGTCPSACHQVGLSRPNPLQPAGPW